MKQRNKWLKAMSIALSCAVLATTAPMNVFADEVTTKVDVAVEATDVVETVAVEKSDMQKIWGYIYDNPNFTVNDDWDVDIMSATTDIYVDKNNSIYNQTVDEKNESEPTGGCYTVKGSIYAVGIFGIDASRDASDTLKIDGYDWLAYKGYKYYTASDLESNPSLKETYEVFDVRGEDIEPGYELSTGYANLKIEDLGSQIVSAQKTMDMPEYDMYMIRYYYVTNDGKEMVTSYPYILDGTETDLKFADDTEDNITTPDDDTETEVPDDTNKPEDDSNNSDTSYEVTLPADKTAISASDFAAVLEANKTQDVVIKSNNNITFTFAKGTMANVDGMENYDFGSSVVSDFANAGNMGSSVTKDNFVTRINYNYSGKLPAKAEIKIYVGTAYAEGTTLYYSKIVEDGFKLIQSVKVDKDGYITISQDSCSDYVVTTNDLTVTTPEDTQKPEDTTKPEDTQKPEDTTKPDDNKTDDTEPSAPKTGDNMSLFMTALTFVSGMGLVVFGLKKRNFVK